MYENKNAQRACTNNLHLFPDTCPLKVTCMHAVSLSMFHLGARKIRPHMCKHFRATSLLKFLYLVKVAACTRQETNRAHTRNLKLGDRLETGSCLPALEFKRARDPPSLSLQYLTAVRHKLQKTCMWRMIAGALAIFQVRRHIPKTNSGFQVRILMCGSVPQNNMKPSRFMYRTTSRDAVGEHNCAHLIAQPTNWKKPNMRKHPQMQEHGFSVVSGDLRTHRILAQFQIVTETIRFDGTSREWSGKLLGKRVHVSAVRSKHVPPRPKPGTCLQIPCMR